MRRLCRLLQAQIMASLMVPACAGADTDMRNPGIDLIERKAQLGYQMLDQITLDEAARLREALTVLVRSPHDHPIEQRMQQIDAVLAQIADLYRKRHDRRDLIAQQDKGRYMARVEEIDSLKQNFDSARSGAETESLDEQIRQFQASYDGASEAARTGDYTTALERMDRAREHLVMAFSALHRSRTIEYRLVFDDIADEYQYELRRYGSQMLLLELAMRERPMGSDMEKLIAKTLSTAKALHAEAQTHAESARYQDALQIQESAVGKLDSILRLLGYYF